ncbi:nicotinate-nucleotide pyrophosphorylase [Acetobacter aceti NRIC 0242]|uniref:Probable nicotinate-nucleotide pyrophosphorylase [carboxylating] n=1 Tax=Acetobacter aceti NBRC 14818 TaxID=887700 RepID=A0AB33I9F8_ACEAC|nr:carboxylating nicotinate-nucleotide diphosphorylase [Acetobacter aceti]TCS34931.1 nicotinate-nucleotide pyrophosphorylase [carboxylating] [Acetobacter aceti NBRC 14818]BCK74489.1 nicotinate-nucleotide diphosphorylase (carboxylating) [Acetobacter aceti NBRC 14818]GAN55998.1 nicotinate-nucleotide pyrophosphorylase [Acetobacter aceti NBRC 14818]GBO80162.1 nicotinate-nucleotide pyrophosphorylase [Acetobacter aceti NRIC 0242]
MNAAYLPSIMWEPMVRGALLEDFGIGGDVTTEALGRSDVILQAVFSARKAGVIAGLPGAALAFSLLNPSVTFDAVVEDGQRVEEGETVARVSGPARAILGGERTALNLLCHLSGIASTTRSIVDIVQGTKARVCCTRKTLPGLRSFQKYAVLAGGGSNHRYRLDDAILIKDNHIALCGGSITTTLDAARQRAGHLMKIELEVDTLEQLETALEHGGADAFLLDNMSTDQLRTAVALIDGRAVAEASGGIRPDTARAIAETGVDILSLGWLTQTVTALDIGLDIA